MLILNVLGDSFDEIGLIDHIGDLGNYYRCFSSFPFLHLCFTAHDQLAAPSLIGFNNAFSPQNNSTRREVRAWHTKQNFSKIYISRIRVDKILKGIYNFTQIMRRDVRCHTYCYSRATINKQVGEHGRQIEGFL